MTLTPKVFFRIGEVSGLVGVEPHVLRYWEREFRTIRPSKSAKGQRVYSRKDVENLLRVKDLLYAQGFTIAGARRRLKGPDAAPAAPAVHMESKESKAAPAAPRSAPAPGGVPPVREKLLVVRAELLAFLEELGG